MKKIFGLLTTLLLVSPVMADDVVMHGGGNENPAYVWIVIDDDIYFCSGYGVNIENPVCHKAEMKD